MIDRNQRVVFLAENHAGAAPWYQLAYQRITEETPYAFSKVAQLTDPAKLAASCRPNRGPAVAPLFLVNHWITTDPFPCPRTRRRSTPAPPCCDGRRSAGSSAVTSRTCWRSTSTAAAISSAWWTS